VNEVELMGRLVGRANGRFVEDWQKQLPVPEFAMAAVGEQNPNHGLF
jgi:hypothetical protein